VAWMLALSSYAQFEGDVFKCDNETFDLLKKLSESRIKNGDIVFSVTTHQDVAWLDTPQLCEIWRDTEWISLYLEKLRKNPDFKFEMEQVYILREYLERHPEEEAFIREMMSSGRLAIGGGFSHFYGDMYFDECLVRNQYLGIKWLKNNFNYIPKVFYDVDTEGRTMQSPQVLSKSGVPYLNISRHKEGFFRWYSPDGSYVTAYSPGVAYSDTYFSLAKEDAKFFEDVANTAIKWSTVYNNKPIDEKIAMPFFLNYEFVFDEVFKKDVIKKYDGIIAKWNALKKVQAADGRQAEFELPKFQYSTIAEFMDRAVANTDCEGIEHIMGERPLLWLFIHNPTHTDSISISRKADILLPNAEKANTFASLIDNSFAKYPTEKFDEAWFSKIYPDHGMGGKNGDVSDYVFKEHFQKAHNIAEYYFSDATKNIASSIKFENKNIPLVVFNMLSWNRDDVVSAKISFDDGNIKDVSLFDAGELLPTQLSDIKYYPSGSIKSADLTFVAKAVPSLGYKTFYLKTSDKVLERKSVEQKYYDVKFSAGGIAQIEDKELGVSVFDNTNFLGGEIFTLQSNGSDAMQVMQLASMEGFEKASAYKAEFKLIESGSVFDKYELLSDFKNLKIKEYVTIYKGIKKIDIDLCLKDFDGTMYREFRMALPLEMTDAKVSYEVPYGVCTIGESEVQAQINANYEIKESSIHPRSISNWISASDSKFGFTMSSSVGVFEHTNHPMDIENQKPNIQPILLMSRKSCHWEGCEYRQYGSHYYNFSITTHKPNWQNGHRFGKQGLNKLVAEFNPKTFAGASLNDKKSFFDIDEDLIVVSAIKKAEDDNSVIVRLYNLSDKEKTVSLKSAYKPKKIIHTNIIEEEIGEVKEIKLGKFAIETFKLIF